MPGAMYGSRWMGGQAYEENAMAFQNGGLPERGYLAGDPVWGLLAGLALPGIKKLGGALLRKGAKAAGGAATVATLGSTALAVIPRGQIAALAAKTGIIARRGGVGGLGLAAGAAAGAGLGAVGAGLMRGEGRRYRRMNALNPQALKRATRRLAAFDAFARSTESQLRKLAPRSTRCAPRKKTCR